MNKNIVILGLANRGGGSETFLLKTLPYVIDNMKGFNFYLFIDESRRGLYDSISNLVVKAVPTFIFSNPLKRFSYENLAMKKEILGLSPDLIFVASECIPYSIRKLKCPIIINYHATVQLNKRYENVNLVRRIYDVFARKSSLKRSEMIVFVSHTSKSEIAFAYPLIDNEKMCVIYHGIEKNNICANDIGIDLPEKYILSVGDMHPHKHYPKLISYFSKLKKEYHISEKLVIVGRKKSSEENDLIKRTIVDYNISEDVLFFDHIDSRLIDLFYKNASLYVTASEVESFGLTPLEAMSCDVPAIISWNSALPEVYAGYSGFFDPILDSEDEICALIYKSLNDFEFRKELINEGNNLVSRFSWRKTGEKFSKLFLKVMNCE